MVKKLGYVLVGILLIFNIYLLYLNNSLNVFLHKTIKEYTHYKQIIDDDALHQRKIDSLEILSSLISIDTLSLSSDLNYLNLKKQELSKIVIYLPQNICLSCYENHLLKLKEINIDKNKLIIFRNFSSHNQLLNFKEYYKLPFESYSIDKSIGTPLDMLNLPFIFVLKQNYILNPKTLDKNNVPEFESYIQVMQNL